MYKWRLSPETSRHFKSNAYAILKVLMVAIGKLIGNDSGYPMKITALDIANWFIVKANSEKLDDTVSEGVTNLKLQKLLYFAQAAHLSVFSNKPLFEEEIVAWKLGPVIESVYHRFKLSNSQPIPKPSNQGYLKIKPDLASFLDNIWSIFGKFSAAKLVQMSHEHQPWKQAYKTEGSVISKESIYEYYKDAFQVV